MTRNGLLILAVGIPSAMLSALWILLIVEGSPSHDLYWLPYYLLFTLLELPGVRPDFRREPRPQLEPTTA